MTMAEAWFLDHPDSSTRHQKTVWRQVRRATGQAALEALGHALVANPVVTCCGVDSVLAGALSRDLGVDVRRDDPAGPPGEMSHLVIAILGVGQSAGERLGVLRRAYQLLRPAGSLVLAATVVGESRTGRSRYPSMAELTEELQAATGGGLHIEELRSVRWTREPIVRGVVLTAASLAVSESW